MKFREMEVTVTMTGEEWFTVVAKLAGNSLSDKGKIIYARASEKMRNQIGAVADACDTEGNYEA